MFIIYRLILYVFIQSNNCVYKSTHILLFLILFLSSLLLPPHRPAHWECSSLLGHEASRLKLIDYMSILFINCCVKKCNVILLYFILFLPLLIMWWLQGLYWCMTIYTKHVSTRMHITDTMTYFTLVFRVTLNVSGNLYYYWIITSQRPH